MKLAFLLDNQNRIIRDGKEGVFGIKKEKRMGKEYLYN
jgi:hypothetical protein